MSPISPPRFTSGSVSALAQAPDASHYAALVDQAHIVFAPAPSPCPSPHTTHPLSSLPCPIEAPSLTSLTLPSASTLYTGDARGALTRYTLPSGPGSLAQRAFAIPAAHSGIELTAVAARSPDSHILSAAKDGSVRAWDPSTRQCIARLTGHRYDVRALSLAESDDNGSPVTIVASAGRDRTVRLWDVRTGSSSSLHVFNGHTGWVHSVALAAGTSPIAVSASGDKTVRVWDLRTMSQRAVLTGHEYRVWSVSVTADGALAVSASTDATVRAWNLDGIDDNGKTECKVFEPHTDSVLAVALHPDGEYVVSAGEDGAVLATGCKELFGRERTVTEGELIQVDDRPSQSSRGVPVQLDRTPLRAEKLAGDSELKRVIAASPESAPGYDKSAAELVGALRRIQELEKVASEAEKRAVTAEGEVAALRKTVASRDDELAKLRKEVNESRRLVQASQVRALLTANPRKADVSLDYEEPVNKIGAVSDQLSALAARLDAMIPTN